MLKTSLSIFGIGALVLALLTGCGNPSSAVLVAPLHDLAQHPRNPGSNDLYVADYDTGTVIRLKNDSFTLDGKITNGVSGPWGVTLDREGNLYVANAAGGNVTKYAPGASTPSFTYSYQMLSPRGIAVDRQGNLFVADFTGYDGPGRIDEYAPTSNRLLQTCFVPGISDVAFDSAGNVFADVNDRQNGGRIEEFAGGIAGCSPTVLGVHVETATGIVLDRRNDLLVGDSNEHRIDVIPPPYSSVSRYLHADGGGPFFISIDRSNRKVYASIARFYGSYVLVIDFASGKPERRLGEGNRGFDSPYGVVDAPDDIP